MRPAKHTVFLVLIVSQMISLLSLILWFSLYDLISRSGRAIDEVGPLFQVYPVLPFALSALAWFAYRLRRWNLAMTLTLVPAVIATLLMSYYFVIGLAQHFV